MIFTNILSISLILKKQREQESLLLTGSRDVEERFEKRTG